jgi:hypothetical protein
MRTANINRGWYDLIARNGLFSVTIYYQCGSWSSQETAGWMKCWIYWIVLTHGKVNNLIWGHQLDYTGKPPLFKSLW